MTAETETVGTTAAAAALGVTTQTVRNWCARGAMPGAVQFGAAWRIPRASVNRARRGGVSFDAPAADSPATN